MVGFREAIQRNSSLLKDNALCGKERKTSKPENIKLPFLMYIFFNNLSESNLFIRSEKIYFDFFY